MSGALKLAERAGFEYALVPIQPSALTNAGKKLSFSDRER
jgi:hypothetical protein